MNAAAGEKDGELEGLCAICRSRLPDEERGIVRCGHVFCFACIHEWTKKESKCPFCRQRVRAITKTLSAEEILEIAAQHPKRAKEKKPVTRAQKKRAKRKSLMRERPEMFVMTKTIRVRPRSQAQSQARRQANAPHPQAPGGSMHEPTPAPPVESNLVNSAMSAAAESGSASPEFQGEEMVRREAAVECSTTAAFRAAIQRIIAPGPTGYRSVDRNGVAGLWDNTGSTSSSRRSRRFWNGPGAAAFGVAGRNGASPGSAPTRRAPRAARVASSPPPLTMVTRSASRAALAASSQPPPAPDGEQGGLASGGVQVSTSATSGGTRPTVSTSTPPSTAVASSFTVPAAVPAASPVFSPAFSPSFSPSLSPATTPHPFEMGPTTGNASSSTTRSPGRRRARRAAFRREAELSASTARASLAHTLSREALLAHEDMRTAMPADAISDTAWLSRSAARPRARPGAVRPPPPAASSWPTPRTARPWGFVEAPVTMPAIFSSPVATAPEMATLPSGHPVAPSSSSVARGSPIPRATGTSTAAQPSAASAPRLWTPPVTARVGAPVSFGAAPLAAAPAMAGAAAGDYSGAAAQLHPRRYNRPEGSGDYGLSDPPRPTVTVDPHEAMAVDPSASPTDDDGGGGGCCEGSALVHDRPHVESPRSSKRPRR